MNDPKNTDVLYRPGLAGWWQFLRLSELIAECHTGHTPDRAAALRVLTRRIWPSARLRQSELERAYWCRLAIKRGDDA